MKKYRKKAVVVEAYQTDKKIVIHTLEGDMTASPGDYIRFFVNSWGNPKNEIKIFNKRQKIKLSLVFLIDRQTYVKYDCENA